MSASGLRGPRGIGDLAHVALHNLERHITSTADTRVFFALVSLDNSPLYVSEVAWAYGDPQFSTVAIPKHFAMKKGLRLEVYILRALEWVPLFLLLVDVRNLRPVSLARMSLPSQSLTTNAVVWTFEVQKYCLKTHVVDNAIFTAPATTTKHTKRLYGFDDIRLLRSFEIKVAELYSTKRRLSGQIEEVSAHVTESEEKTSKYSTPESILNKYIYAQQRDNERVQSALYNSKVFQSQVREAMDVAFPSYKSVCGARKELAEQLSEPLAEALKHLIYPEVSERLREAGTLLQLAFQINESATMPGLFSIAGVELPTSIAGIAECCYYSGDPTAVDSINAGLGLVVRLLQLMLSIWEVDLKYKMTHLGSFSYIEDHLAISADEASKYPVFYDPSTTERTISYEASGRQYDLRNEVFERGLRLLNRNLLGLICGISDIYRLLRPTDGSANHAVLANIPGECRDNFLWSLKYVMLYITAG